MEDFRVHRINAINNLKNIVHFAADCNLEEVLDISSYLNPMEELSKLGLRSSDIEHAIQEAGQAETVQEFEEIYKSEINKEVTDPKSTEEYKEFVKETNELFSSKSQSSNLSQEQTELDGMTLLSYPSIIDPITKKRMEFPVKNKICNHYYEKNSIIQSIRLNSKLRCPMVGCCNKQFIKIEDLIDDIQFRMYLERTKDAEQ